MSNQADSDERGSTKSRAILLKDFRGVLVANWPEQESMDRIISDAELTPADFTFDASQPVNRWHKALAKMNSRQLLAVARVVRDEIAEPVDAVEAIMAFEETRLKEAETRLHAEAMAGFNSLLEHRDAIAGSIKMLRDPEHASDETLTTLKDRLGKIYEYLDKLRSAQRPNVTPSGEAGQLSDIERRANTCIDALQLYTTLLGYTEPDDISQVGVVNAPGRLGERASDEVILLQAKAALRNALIRLTKAGHGR
jgi:hypothetical protein